ncbi:MAG: FAD-binding protein, partial [Hyphomonas sp.]|nr:FAD-binding protein [Hyphomonas sp.]
MGVSRRNVILAGAGLTAAAAIPAVQHVAWGSKSFVRDDYTPDFPDAPAGEESWMNWSGAQSATPKQFQSPASEAELSELVRTSAGRIRPRGSGHSFSGLVTSEGMILDVGQLSGLKSYDDTTGRATFGAGTVLFQAASQLNDVGRAFPNLPDIVDQTLAGSFSTATHGTGQSLTALHDYIHAFKLVTADGSVREVTRESDPDLFAAGKV